MDVFMLILNK